MRAESQQVRSLQQVLSDKLYPDRNLSRNPESADRRHQAVTEVLCRLPEDVYEQVKRLKHSRRSFEWFIPDLGEWGLTYPFLPNVKRRAKQGTMPRARYGASIMVPYARVVYLSPLLELSAWDSIVLTAAHELAHVVLNHSMDCIEPEADRCEREVFGLVCAWGFEREAKKHEALRKAADTEDDNRSEQLAPLISLVRAAGIETLWFCQEQRPGQACIEFASAGDGEMFLNIAQREYKVEAEQWDEGGDGKHSFRLQMLVFFPMGDVPRLVEVFSEYNHRSRPPEGSGKPPQHGGQEIASDNPATRPS